MANSWWRRVHRFFKALSVVSVAPMVSVEVPGFRRFPTRTVEIDRFSFDPGTGTISWEQTAKKEPYALTVEGLVEAPVQLRYEQLRSLTTVTQVSDFHCVEGWTIPQVRWTGFTFQELLKLVKPDEGADFVVFHSLGRTRSEPEGQGWYIEPFKVSDLLDPDQEMLLALDMDGTPLSYDRGAPLRVITPYRLAYKSIKFVSRVEFTSEMKNGWWTLANPIYDVDARVPGSRLRGK